MTRKSPNKDPVNKLELYENLIESFKGMQDFLGITTAAILICSMYLAGLLVKGLRNPRFFKVHYSLNEIREALVGYTTLIWLSLILMVIVLLVRTLLKILVRFFDWKINRIKLLNTAGKSGIDAVRQWILKNKEDVSKFPELSISESKEKRLRKRRLGLVTEYYCSERISGDNGQSWNVEVYPDERIKVNLINKREKEK